MLFTEWGAAQQEPQKMIWSAMAEEKKTASADRLRQSAEAA
jgi:hypothetical protein